MKAFMGGTFDPVHCGHMQMAMEALEYLSVERVSLLPCFQPVHKNDSKVALVDRLAMLELAVEDNPSLSIDRREIERGSHSYTIDTLASMRAEYGEESIVMIMGGDSFAALNSWRSASQFSRLCHVLVMGRPGYDLERSHFESMVSGLGFKWVTDSSGFRSASCGRIGLVKSSLLEISSSSIRERVRKKYTIRYLVPSAVCTYICDNGLYES